MFRRSMLAGVPAAAMLSRPAAAQGFPTRPVRLIVPYAPGGSTDLMARFIAERLPRVLGQPGVVENRPGASEQLGAGALLGAPADGHSMMLATSIGLAINPSLFPRLPYNPATDFAPISLVAKIPSVLVVNPAVPARDLAELTAHMRRTTLNYGSAGAGAPSHLAMELFKRAAGVDATYVSYRGGAPALQDLVAGNIQVMIALVSEAMPFVADGRLRALAITSPTRAARYPQLPPVAEVPGMAGFEIYLWFAMIAHAGTPRPMVEALGRAVHAVLDERDVRDRLTALDIEVENGPPEALTRVMATEGAKWKAIIDGANIRLD
jgi:tripartite-type tricarboxylate transporter receptor subunit TctC